MNKYEDYKWAYVVTYQTQSKIHQTVVYKRDKMETTSSYKTLIDYLMKNESGQTVIITNIIELRNDSYVEKSDTKSVEIVNL